MKREKSIKYTVLLQKCPETIGFFLIEITERVISKHTKK